MTDTIGYTPLQRFYYAGERVRIQSPNFNGLATVKKHLKKNVDIVLDDGRPVRCHPSFLTPVDAKENPAPPRPVQTTKLPEHQGTIVRVAPRLVDRQPQLRGLWVVVGSQGDKTRICKIGGDHGRYWRIPNNDIIKVEVIPTDTGFTLA